jgi:hypothetical protein
VGIIPKFYKTQIIQRKSGLDSPFWEKAIWLAPLQSPSLSDMTKSDTVPNSSRKKSDIRFTQLSAYSILKDAFKQSNWGGDHRSIPKIDLFYENVLKAHLSFSRIFLKRKISPNKLF